MFYNDEVKHIQNIFSSFLNLKYTTIKKFVVSSIFAQSNIQETLKNVFTERL